MDNGLNVRRGRSAIVRASDAAAASLGRLAALLRGRVTLLSDTEILLSAGRAADVASFRNMSSGEAALATQAVRVSLLVVGVSGGGVTARRELAGSRSVGVVQGRAAAGDIERSGISVPLESTTLLHRFSSERVIGNGTRLLLDGSVVAFRVRGDLKAVNI